jgi:hypothetical protein
VVYKRGRYTEEDYDFPTRVMKICYETKLMTQESAINIVCNKHAYYSPPILPPHPSSHTFQKNQFTATAAPPPITATYCAAKPFPLAFFISLCKELITHQSSAQHQMYSSASATPLPNSKTWPISSSPQMQQPMKQLLRRWTKLRGGWARKIHLAPGFQRGPFPVWLRGRRRERRRRRRV